MKNLKVIVPVVVIALFVGGIIWQTMSNRQAPTLVSQEQLPEEPDATALFPVEITYTDQGYSPASVTIKKGDWVVWKNEGTKDMWPASAMHPTHAVYPGSGIQKCNTAEWNRLFDACMPITPGSSWSFRFLQQGSWKFHDHLSPTKFGTINVE